jgi:hypothetical protein
MKTASLAFTVTAMALAAVQVQGGVKVSSGEVKEIQVTLRVADGRYVTANPPGLIDLSGIKVGSKQKFTIIDLNGGNLADGDEVRIRYTPNKDGKPDPSKASYWREGREGVTRAHQDGTFTIKRVGTRFAFLGPSGKYVTANEVNGALAVSSKLEDALVVEITDLSPTASAAPPAKPAAEQAVTSAPQSPANE